MTAKNFCEHLNLKVPLIVAPMAGGPSSIDFVAASSEAGALGSVGAAYLPPHSIEDFVTSVRIKTHRPFAINLFVPPKLPVLITEIQKTRAFTATQKYRDELSLPSPILNPPYEENFDSQFETVLKLKPNVFSFVFGPLKSECIAAAKKEKILLVGTSTTPEEALELQDSGIDAIIIQGREGGGHRGIFDANAEDPNLSLVDLLERCRQKIKIPLIAAGGLMNKEDINNILQRGADVVQMGTAFLACNEAGTSPAYRHALQTTAHRKTKLTRAFSGRLARGIENRFMREMGAQPDAILPFPAQNAFTRDIRAASAKNNSDEFLSLWSGTGQGQLWTGSVAGLIQNLF